MMLKIFLATLILSFLTFSAVNGHALDTADHTIKTVQSDTPLASTSGDNYEDDFSPGMLFFALIGIGLVCICAGIGIAVAAVALLIVVGLIAIGVLSTSVIVGLRNKSFTKGFKTLLIMSASIGGIGIGTGALFLINQLFNLHLADNAAILIGSVSGLIGGVIIGQLSYVMLLKVINIFKQRLNLTA